METFPREGSSNIVSAAGLAAHPATLPERVMSVSPMSDTILTSTFPLIGVEVFFFVAQPFQNTRPRLIKARAVERRKKLDTDTLVELGSGLL